MSDKDIKVLLIEDHMMIRMGTALVIEKTEGITLAGDIQFYIQLRCHDVISFCLPVQ